MSAASFSVVVPSRDRPAQLAACLQALGRLDHPRDRLEVIVVDDGGRADLGQVGAAAPPELPVELIRREPGGPAARATPARPPRRGSSWRSRTTTASRSPPGSPRSPPRWPPRPARGAAAGR